MSSLPELRRFEDPSNPDLIRNIAENYRAVLQDSQYLPDEKVGYICAVCAVDPLIPGWWLVSEKRQFAKAVVAHFFRGKP